jgi:hypothetical protein
MLGAGFFCASRTLACRLQKMLANIFRLVCRVAHLAFPGQFFTNTMSIGAITHWITARRLLSGVLLVCCMQAANAFAQGPPDVNVFSFADTSCAEWVHSKNNKLSRAIYGAWFRGFVSGYNFGNSANQVALDKMPDEAALALYIDNYCRDNPKLPFIGAAIPLVQEIREIRSVAPGRRP